MVDHDMGERRDGSAITVDSLLDGCTTDDVESALLEVVAAQVLAEHPDDSLVRCQMYMGGRLEDIASVRAAIERLSTFDQVDVTLLASANGAMRAGDFDAMHVALGLIEDSIVRGQKADADVLVAGRVARAETALLQGNPIVAARQFATASAYLEQGGSEPNREDEATLTRSRMVGRLIEYADFYGGDGGWIDDAMELCYANIRLGDTHTWNRGARQMDAGHAQLTAGKLMETPEALNLFLQAEYAFRIASSQFGKETFPADWAAAENARGLAFAHCCFRDPTGSVKTEHTGGWWIVAEDCYLSAMAMQRREGESIPWAKTCVNLGFLLLHRGRAEGGEKSRDFLAEAIARCRSGQEVLTGEEHPEEWVGTQMIVVESLIELGDLSSEDPTTYYREALAEATNAQDFLALREMPVIAEEVEGLVALVHRKTGELLG